MLLLRCEVCQLYDQMQDDAFISDSPGICGAKVHSDDYSVRRNLNMSNRIAIAIDDRRRS
jgi:hypothetical protein